VEKPDLKVNSTLKQRTC